MNLLLQHWSFDPFLIGVAAVVALHERGLHNLARRSRPARTAARRRRSWAFYGGLALLALTVTSPIDYWANHYFTVHMIEHLLLMFGVPMLVVYGAPWIPLLHGLPVGVRRRAGRSLVLGRWASPLRAVGRVVRSPAFAIVGFNVVMVLWHLPGPFDLAERDQTVHIWLMHGSFVGFGTLFWLQFIRSHPFSLPLSPARRAQALFLTNVVMFFLAMALSIFSSHPWYTAYAHVSHPGLSRMADQDLGAAILWVCGDFWAFPTFVRAVQAYIDEDRRPAFAFRPAGRPLVRTTPSGVVVSRNRGDR